MAADDRIKKLKEFIEELKKRKGFKDQKERNEFYKKAYEVLSDGENFRDFLALYQKDPKLAKQADRLLIPASMPELAQLGQIAMPASLEARADNRAHTFQIFGATGIGKSVGLEYMLRGAPEVLFEATNLIKAGKVEEAKAILENYIKSYDLSEKTGTKIDAKKQAETMVPAIQEYSRYLGSRDLDAKELVQGSKTALDKAVSWAVLRNIYSPQSVYVETTEKGARVKKVLPNTPFMVFDDILQNILDAGVLNEFMQTLGDKGTPVAQAQLTNNFSVEAFENLQNTFGKNPAYAARAGLFFTAVAPQNVESTFSNGESTIKELFMGDLIRWSILDAVLGDMLKDENSSKILNELIGNDKNAEKAVKEIKDAIRNSVGTKKEKLQELRDRFAQFMGAEGLIDWYRERVNNGVVDPLIENLFKIAFGEDFNKILNNVEYLADKPLDAGKLMASEYIRSGTDTVAEDVKKLPGMEDFIREFGREDIKFENREKSKSAQLLRKTAKKVSEIIRNAKEKLDEQKNKAGSNEIIRQLFGGKFFNIDEAAGELALKVTEGAKPEDMAGTVSGMNYRGVCSIDPDTGDIKVGAPDAPRHLKQLSEILAAAKKVLSPDDYKLFAFRTILQTFGMSPLSQSLLKDFGLLKEVERVSPETVRKDFIEFGKQFDENDLEGLAKFLSDFAKKVKQAGMAEGKVGSMKGILDRFLNDSIVERSKRPEKYDPDNPGYEYDELTTFAKLLSFYEKIKDDDAKKRELADLIRKYAGDDAADAMSVLAYTRDLYKSLEEGDKTLNGALNEKSLEEIKEKICKSYRSNSDGTLNNVKSYLSNAGSKMRDGAKNGDGRFYEGLLASLPLYASGAVSV